MNGMLTRAAVLLSFCLLSVSARATFHLWELNEVFTNSDGTIQYIELHTASPSEGFLSGHGIVSSGPGVPTQEFTFPGNLAGDTSNRTLLIATQRFANLTGLDPDFVIPAGFIPISGGTLNFAEGADVLSYTKEQLPLNGLQSMNGNAQPQSSSPTRFDGLSAQLPLQTDPFASFNDATGILNIPVLNAPGIGVANVNFTVDLVNLEFFLLDFYLYGPGIGAGNLPTQFLNGTTLYIPSLRYNGEQYEANLTMLSGDPIVFGNPEVLSLIPVPPDPEPNAIPPDNNPPPDIDPPRGY